VPFQRYKIDKWKSSCPKIPSNCFLTMKSVFTQLFFI